MTVRKDRIRSNIRRKGPRRESYDRVLIVCEGTRTESSYFLDLAEQYQLSSVNIKIMGTGSDPSNLVKQAKILQKKEKDLGESYDQVYCVFDKDSHAKFSSASLEAQANRFKLARSWPCFEFWLLLHFEYTRHPYSRTSKSPCTNCIEELRRHIPDYEKASQGLFEKLIGLLETAKGNATKVLADVERTGESNPSTEIHLLVEYLQMLRSSGQP